MNPKSTRPSLGLALRLLPMLALVALAGASVARAQETPPEGTDKERLEAAKKEQAAAEKAAELKKAQDAKTAEQKAAAAELEKLGADAEEAPPEESKGFFVGVGAFWAEVGGGDRDIARIGDVSTTATTAETLDTDPVGTGAEGEGLPDNYSMTNERTLSLEYDSEISPVIEAGYRMERRGMISVRYWGWSSDASLDASSSTTYPSTDPLQGNLVLGGIDNQGREATTANFTASPQAFSRPYGSPREITANGLHGADSVSAEGSLELSRIDLMYSRMAIAKKRLELSYRAGLTFADATREESARFEWRSFDRSRVPLNALSVEDVSSSCDTSGIGVMAGIAGRFGLTANRRWGVRLGLEVAGLKADKELRFRDVQQFTQDGLVPPPDPQVYQDTFDDDAGDFVTIVDLDAAIEYRWGQRMRAGLGWRQGTYFSMLTEEKFPSGANLAQMESKSVDLDVGGPYLRIGFFF